MGGGGWAVADCSLESSEFSIMQLFRFTFNKLYLWMLLWYSDERVGTLTSLQVLNPTCSRPPYGKIDSNLGICAQTQTPKVFSFK